jgi:microcystin-dependent protein
MKRQIATALLTGVLSFAGLGAASAQDPYVAEVRLFAFNWCPTGWFQAAGQTLAISQYSALFALLGTSFGGNGTTNFNLPNLSGRAPYGQLYNNQGQPFGAAYGNSTVTLTTANLPPHTHQLFGSTANPGYYSPNGALLATDANTAAKTYAPQGSAANAPMAANAIGFTGSSIPISTQSPALSMNWCIAYNGIFPSRP